MQNAEFFGLSVVTKCSEPGDSAVTYRTDDSSDPIIGQTPHPLTSKQHPQGLLVIPLDRRVRWRSIQSVDHFEHVLDVQDEPLGTDRDEIVTVRRNVYGCEHDPILGSLSDGKRAACICDLLIWHCYRCSRMLERDIRS